MSAATRTSALVEALSVQQLEDSLCAETAAPLSGHELAAIEPFPVDDRMPEP